MDQNQSPLVIDFWKVSPFSYIITTKNHWQIFLFQLNTIYISDLQGNNSCPRRSNRLDFILQRLNIEPKKYMFGSSTFIFGAIDTWQHLWHISSCRLARFAFLFSLATSRSLPVQAAGAFSIQTTANTVSIINLSIISKSIFCIWLNCLPFL